MRITEVTKETCIITRKKAYKVRMKSGIVTREVWVKNAVKVGQLVKPPDGRIFKVLSVVELSDVPAMQLMSLDIRKS